MNRSRRSFFLFATAVSLMLCAATIALWVRGRVTWSYDTLIWSGPFREGSGQASLRASNTPFGIHVANRRVPLLWNEPGFGFGSSRSTLVGSDSVADAFQSLGGHGLGGIWWASAAVDASTTARRSYRTGAWSH